MEAETSSNLFCVSWRPRKGSGTIWPQLRGLRTRRPSGINLRCEMSPFMKWAWTDQMVPTVLRSPRMQMLISSRSTFTDIARNNVESGDSMANHADTENQKGFIGTIIVHIPQCLTLWRRCLWCMDEQLRSWIPLVESTQVAQAKNLFLSLSLTTHSGSICSELVFLPCCAFILKMSQCVTT